MESNMRIENIFNSSSSAPPTLSTNQSRCELPLEMAFTMFVLNIVVGFFGTWGNILVCVSVMITPSLQRISNYFICSLAVADLSINLIDQPLLVVMLWGRSKSLCFPQVELAFRIVGNVSCAVSLVTLCFISIDRCVSITKPFNYQSIITPTKFYIMLVASWVLPGVYTYIRIDVSKKITSYVTVGLFGSSYILLAVCYLLIFIQIKKQGRERCNLAAYREGPSQASQALERRLAVTIAMIIAVFTVAWIPIFYLRVTAPKKNYGVLYDWARTIALSSSAVNPALYCLRNDEYRKAFAKILRFIFCCSKRKSAQIENHNRAPTRRTESTRFTPNENAK
ncbi:octopamine receptor-like [Actinia tenebrosa]|uniref:Octopamine receptor-like n=1 Tax=Actinia tenebrosa TaxID=6105 RepID=A0A6P8I1Y1_ACTTE|nr:octopamine receptor-like [Actinia tenebrosa]